MCVRAGLCVCAFDEVHDEYMHECVTVVMLVYAKQGGERMRREEDGGVFEREFHVCVRACV